MRWLPKRIALCFARPPFGLQLAATNAGDAALSRLDTAPYLPPDHFQRNSATSSIAILCLLRPFAASALCASLISGVISFSAKRAMLYFLRATKMRKPPRPILCLIAAGCALLLLLSRRIVEQVYPDYVAIAGQTGWTWSDERATPDFYAAHLDPAYRIESTAEPWHRVFTLWRGQRRVYDWIGNDATVFTIVGRRLYYADLNLASCGGSVVAVDVGTGSQLWREPLLAVGDWSHSKYGNEMNLPADGRIVTVFGKESCGRYVEIKDTATGRTLGHRAYDDYGTLPMQYNAYPPPEDLSRVRLLRSMRVALSLAFLAVVIPPWLARARQSRRVRSGRCPACGYDLRQSTGRCPECGTPFPADARPIL